MGIEIKYTILIIDQIAKKITRQETEISCGCDECYVRVLNKIIRNYKVS